MSDTIDRATFDKIYAERPPWDIDGPQAPFTTLTLSGTLLDSGCGSGENGLYFAARGVTVTGVDFLEAPIAQAREKARARGLEASATFLTRDALTLGDWDRRFDNAIDSGLMHVFSDADRATYLAGVAHVLVPGGRLHVLCFSDQTPGTEGPRRIKRAELDAAFARGWVLESATPARFVVRDEFKATRFGGQDPHGWFVIARRS